MQSLVLLSALYRSRQNFALSYRTIWGILIGKLGKASGVFSLPTDKSGGQSNTAYAGISSIGTTAARPRRFYLCQEHWSVAKKDVS